MFGAPGLDFFELLVLGIIALIVVGPKDLPKMLRDLGKQIAKFRNMAQEFRTGFDELARQADLDELRREIDALRNSRSITGLVDELSKPLPGAGGYAAPYPPSSYTYIPPASPEPEPDNQLELPFDRAEPEPAAALPSEAEPYLPFEVEQPPRVPVAAERSI